MKTMKLFIKPLRPLIWILTCNTWSRKEKPLRVKVKIKKRDPMHHTSLSLLPIDLIYPQVPVSSNIGNASEDKNRQRV